MSLHDMLLFIYHFNMNCGDEKAFVYIMTNKGRNVLYVGVTNNLERRIYEHKNKLIEGFTKKYNLTVLAYYEAHSRIIDAIDREKTIKKKSRKGKGINV